MKGFGISLSELISIQQFGALLHYQSEHSGILSNFPLSVRLFPCPRIQLNAPVGQGSTVEPDRSWPFDNHVSPTKKEK